MVLSQQEHWSGLPCPTSRDLSDPGIEPVSPAAPALAGGFLTTEQPGKPSISITSDKHEQDHGSLESFDLFGISLLGTNFFFLNEGSRKKG